MSSIRKAADEYPPAALTVRRQGRQRHARRVGPRLHARRVAGEAEVAVRCIDEERVGVDVGEAGVAVLDVRVSDNPRSGPPNFAVKVAPQDRARDRHGR